MQFTHYNLGHMNGGEIIEIMLSGSAANVRLMDTPNFSSYRAGNSHRYYGGLAVKSPIRLQVPNAGSWHVTVDMAGLRGTVRSSIRLLPSAPRPLAPIREAPLSTLPSLVRNRPLDVGLPPSQNDQREFDVFISHASEDKDEVVRPLALALQAGGLDVWYDEFELKIGDSLRRKIDSGLSRSRFGVVVMSKPFFNKGWSQYELDGLVTKTVNGEQVMLPIWHNISKQEVISFSPSLADKLARSTSTRTVQEIADEIVAVIKASHG